MSNVSGVIKSIQDIMRKDVGVDNDAQRISQLVWMFFLKIFDDREAELELLEDDYKSPLPEHLRWCAWATNPEGMTGDALADFVNVQLFPYLKEKLPTAGAQGKRAQVVRSVFEDAYNYMKSGTLMRQVINKICEIDFNNSGDRHTFGSIYEQILRDLQSAGNAGEFYTPRAVTRFIVNRVDPKLDESVLDPACGTGGFLTCAIDHKREHYVKTRADEETLVNTLRGVEKKALPHMLAVTNMILHGIDTPTRIKHDNTLSRPYKDYGNADRVNVIITNPPFGGMEEDGIENNFPANYRTRETADLFMALIVKLLKDQGRAAVVLPDGFLFGEGMKTRLKQSLLEECNLHTIVRLPNAMQRVFHGHSFATQQTDKNLAYALDNLLRALANSAEFGGYAYGKLSAAFESIQQYLNSIGGVNHLDDDFERNIHELLTIPASQLETLVANKVDGSFDYHAIRLISALLQHGKNQCISQKSFCELPSAVNHEFGDYISLALSASLGVSVPDRLDQIYTGDIQSLCEDAWNNLDKPIDLRFFERVKWLFAQILQ